MNFHEFSMQGVYRILVGFEKDLRGANELSEKGETAQTPIFLQYNTCLSARIRSKRREPFIA